MFWVYREHLRPGCVALDVGANQGAHTRQMASRVGARGAVIAFEPIPILYHALRTEFAAAREVQVRPQAVSDRAGRATFHINQKNSSYYSGLENADAVSGGTSIPIGVEITTLDALLPQLERLDLVKLDIEGAELHALRGATDLLARFRPLIVFEWGDQSSPIYGTTSDQIWSFFSARGYRLFAISGADCSERAAFVESSRVQDLWNYVAVHETAVESFLPTATKLKALSKGLARGLRNPAYDLEVNVEEFTLAGLYDAARVSGVISNRSDVAWIAESQAWLGPRAVPDRIENAYKLGLVWMDAGGNVAAEERRPLPKEAIFPGERVEFGFDVYAVTSGNFIDPGLYSLWIDILKEGEFWLHGQRPESDEAKGRCIRVEVRDLPLA
jgi:FkbM family methyltransferase